MLKISSIIHSAVENGIGFTLFMQHCTLSC